jgi:exopolyphosphatase / guanosine-5'-triphosphate,3'-diphosphate pyrophosphatase
MAQTSLAAVDLGSNSFHLQIARVVDNQLYPLDNLKETVRLGAGVTSDKDIDPKTAERALAALRLFAERLRGMPPESVRVVGTNALRVAKNASAFVKEAEAAIGFPIEVIAGREEARLIYLGVAKSLPLSGHDRLVVDIGGGSTEFIIGHKLRAKLVDSLYMGCVSYTTRYFTDGEIDRKRFKDAQLAARKEIEQIRAAFLSEGWREAYGSSGTAKALATILTEAGIANGNITLDGLKWLYERAMRAGNVRALELPGLKGDRVPVFAGGLAIMLTVFEELNLREMTTVDTALRDGVLHDMLGRAHHTDVRELTVTQFAKRYHVDMKQAERVEKLALSFFDQLVPAPFADGTEKSELAAEARYRSRQRLTWAAQLHEIGMAVAQAGFHKHGAYIIANADMPGFSKREQARLAPLLLAQRGKLTKISDQIPAGPEFIVESLCLRLAVLLSRSRRNLDAKIFHIAHNPGAAEHAKEFLVRVEPQWLQKNELTGYELTQEVAEWRNIGITLSVTD